VLPAWRLWLLLPILLLLLLLLLLLPVLSLLLPVVWCLAHCTVTIFGCCCCHCLGGVHLVCCENAAAAQLLCQGHYLIHLCVRVCRVCVCFQA
jgi:hypothetical protein